MIKLIKAFWLDDQGATAIEYGLIAALVSVAAIMAMQAMGSSIRLMFGTVSTTLERAIAP